MTKIFFTIMLIVIGTILLIAFSSFMPEPKPEMFSLTVEVNNLRNSKGTVQFTLYNREDAFPDEHYKKYFKKLKGEIVNGVSTATFENLPEGKYAVNILHDENNDGKIKKGMILPREGIGFSNFQFIGISNRPTFSKAAFNVTNNKSVSVKIIYF
jgi:uncharacterized protein (DUF2141 family)